MKERLWLWLTDALTWLGAWRAAPSSWRWRAYQWCLNQAGDAHVAGYYGPDYDRFVESCAKDCRCCSICGDCPCPGVLAGGLCDRLAPPEPKAVEPSDEAMLAVCEKWTGLPSGQVRLTFEQKEATQLLCCRELVNLGRASRDPEVEALKAELRQAELDLRGFLENVDLVSLEESLKREADDRDKLHAALAWAIREHAVGRLGMGPSGFAHSGADEYLCEQFDGTDAGRAAALVRLFERCTDGK